ncbi:hypothetical protein BO94DRAFT_189134 [Aspergillus sclerotioniger CBS 115572]|uniref:Uncharacterized protein n=1 Tax=Aspergillus sclerotioniger CBS 115572 TaxID=1450535 RepID=A0A317VWM0_9EURO|nr:hypothetical protein BO94DRAFT_189134 [Aspergillus sclerotioniger CBS 115572]PWY78175.1 hypothetical protein BO94DRAFT_189134 [Aspergillus sclerotioniger CBS 115572]
MDNDNAYESAAGHSKFINMDRSGQSRKPRRSSFSQHLQRVFHWDKHVTQEKSSRISDPLETAFTRSHRQEQRALPHTDEFIRDNISKSTSSIGTNEDAVSQTPQNSRLSVLNRDGLKKLPAYSVSQGASQISDHSFVGNAFYKQELSGSPSRINKAVHKNERRATRRLEAERLELEKRLLKLEQTGPDQGNGLQKKETRRLTKKQPIRSSSRASSVSADECSSTRLSSLFSSSQRTSRSRSSSLNESDKEPPRHPLIDVREAVSGPDLGIQSIRPHVTLTMPERLGAMISRELATSNALLPHRHNGVATEANTHGIESRTDEAGDHQYHYEKSLSHGLAPLQSHRANIERNIPRVASTAPSPSAPPADLDRLSFAATLNLGTRGFEAVHHSSTITFPNLATKQGNQNHRNSKSIWKTHIESDIGPHAAISPVQPSAALQGELSKTPSNKSPTDRYLQRPHKKYIPSPLAESSSLDGNSSLSLNSKKATTMLKLQASGNAEQTPSSVSTKKDEHPRYDRSHPRPTTRLLTTDVRQCEGVDDPVISIIRGPQEKSPDRGSYPWVYGTKRSSSVGLSGHGVKYIGQSESVGFQDPRLHDKTLAFQENLSRGSQNVPQSERLEACHVSSKSKISQPSVSNSSLATSSEEPQSEDYDTADEARSPVLLAQDHNVHLVRCPDHGTIPTGVNVADGDMLFSLRTSTAAVPDRPEARTDGRMVNMRNLQANSSIGMRFVICCHCSHWHDIPSDVYAKLSPPDTPSVVRARRLSSTQASKSTLTKHTISNLAKGKLFGAPSNLSDSGPSASTTKTKASMSTVQCCWCSHDMNRSCCQGWTAIVHMCRRHH